MLHHFLVVHYVNALGQGGQAASNEAAIETIYSVVGGNSVGIQVEDA